MKCYIPEISWHNRDPVLSIDFQVCQGSVRRVATSGTDAHVVIWLVTLNDSHHANLEVAADLNRHTKTVNVVRFSPNGEILASGDDEAAIILWKQQEKDTNNIFEDDGNENREQWLPVKILRNHIDDVCDLCWSSDSTMLVSGSVDNTAIIWDINKGKNTGILSEHKGFVQGVAWDPQGQFIATLASDRMLRIYNTQTKKVVLRVHKATFPNLSNLEGGNKSSKLFYDDTLKSFCRRLRFSPDGECLVVPSAIQETKDGTFSNGVYIFSRHSLNKPSLWLPTGTKYTIAVSFCPVLFELRTAVHEKQGQTENEEKENKHSWKKHPSLFCLPYRMVYAVATQDSILLYDTQQPIPIAHISNIHYTRLSDITWSSDGKILMASSTDGYCSLVTFTENELGVPYQEVKTDKENTVDMLVCTSGNNKQLDAKTSNDQVMKDLSPTVNMAALETENGSDSVIKLPQAIKMAKPEDKSLQKKPSARETESSKVEDTTEMEIQTESSKQNLDALDQMPSNHHDIKVSEEFKIIQMTNRRTSEGTSEDEVKTDQQEQISHVGSHHNSNMVSQRLETVKNVITTTEITGDTSTNRTEAHAKVEETSVKASSNTEEDISQLDDKETNSGNTKTVDEASPADPLSMDIEKHNQMDTDQEMVIDKEEELKLHLELSNDSPPVEKKEKSTSDSTTENAMETMPPKPSPADRKPPRRIQFITLSGRKANHSDSN